MVELFGVFLISILLLGVMYIMALYGFHFKCREGFQSRYVAEDGFWIGYNAVFGMYYEDFLLKF
jgi:hypothetical protein